MRWLNSLLRAAGRRRPGEELYNALVELARQPDWYAKGRIPDTVDGRFDALALALSLAFMRLHREEARGQPLSKALLERFVDDMDESLREMGVGDLSVGKQVQKMVSALNGRQQAYRAALTAEDPAKVREVLTDALARNAYRGEVPDQQALDWLVDRTIALQSRFEVIGLDALERGQLGEVQLGEVQL